MSRLPKESYKDISSQDLEQEYKETRRKLVEERKKKRPYSKHSKKKKRSQYGDK